MLYSNRHLLIGKFTIHSNPSFIVEVFYSLEKSTLDSAKLWVKNLQKKYINLIDLSVKKKVKFLSMYVINLKLCLKFMKIQFVIITLKISV